MNLFYATLDNRISKFNVYNVHTMADEFMVVSGMPGRIGDRHVSEIASMALDLLAGSVVFQIPHRPNSRLNIRMGLHRYIIRGVRISHAKTTFITEIGKRSGLKTPPMRVLWV